MATGYYFRISFKERMERNDKKGYIYCAHCNNFVSRSTFERHERKRKETNLTDTRLRIYEDHIFELRIKT